MSFLIDTDKFGAAGWELVGTESIISPEVLTPTRTVGIIAFFKRRVADRPHGLSHSEKD